MSTPQDHPLIDGACRTADVGYEDRITVLVEIPRRPHNSANLGVELTGQGRLPIIKSVQPGALAELAGLERGDVLLEVNGHDVDGHPNIGHLLHRLWMRDESITILCYNPIPDEVRLRPARQGVFPLAPWSDEFWDGVKARVLRPTDKPVPIKILSQKWSVGGLCNMQANGWQSVLKAKDEWYFRRDPLSVGVVRSICEQYHLVVTYTHFDKRSTVQMAAKTHASVSLGWRKGGGFTTCAEGSLERECIDIDVARIYHTALYWKSHVKFIRFVCHDDDPLVMCFDSYEAISLVSSDVLQYINASLLNIMEDTNLRFKDLAEVRAAEKDLESRVLQLEYAASVARADAAMVALIAEEEWEETRKTEKMRKKTSRKAAQKARRREQTPLPDASLPSSSDGDDSTAGVSHQETEKTAFGVPPPTVVERVDTSAATRTEMVESTAPPEAVPPTLADLVISTDNAPESSIGGETTCIICMMHPKTHLAAPCGHLCACSICSTKLKACPYCREPAIMWIMQRIV